MRKWIVILTVLSVLVGCKYVLKTAYRIKKPKLEDRKSLNDYLLKNCIDTINVIAFKDFKSFSTASKYDLLLIPDAIFFNKHGDFVPYKESTKNCNANVDNFLNDLSLLSTFPVEEKTKLYDLLLLTNDTNQCPDVADITVLITWTVYSGSLNKEKAFEWIKLLQKARLNGIRVNYYLLNCDFQRSWNLSQKQLSLLGIKKQ